MDPSTMLTSHAQQLSSSSLFEMSSDPYHTASSSSKPPKAKSTSRYNVVGASSLFDLKAELEKGKEKFKQQAAEGASYVKGVQREGKKTTKWAAPSKGLSSRIARQDAQESSSARLGKVDRSSLESSQAGLERKAKIYEQLRKGKTGGLSERQLESVLVDWDTKPDNEGYSDDDSSDEGKNVAALDDPLTDYEDDFGRTRTVPRSEVPIYAMEKRRLAKASLEEKPANLIIGDQNYFPIYEPTQEELKARWEAAEDPAAEKFYDGNAEVRNKSAAFYQFSADATKRAEQQAALLAARAETERARADVEPSLPLQQPSASTSTLPASAPAASTTMDLKGKGKEKEPFKFGGKASEKRKREVEERKRLIEEKRRKKEGEGFWKDLEGELGQPEVGVEEVGKVGDGEREGEQGGES